MGQVAHLAAGAGSARPGYPALGTRRVAGAEGLEPPAYGFGDRRSTN
jgi:hypothetical protein